MMDWISVEDRLPAFSKDVLFSEHGTVHKGWLDHIDKLGNTFRQSGSVCTYTNVSHWMPLPEPPGDEQ